MREDLGSRTRYLAGDDTRRITEWNEAVADPEARAIWCVRGGYGSTRILADLEVAGLVRTPKLVVGFSDITAIHALLNRAGLVTIHGPVVTQLGRLPEVALFHLEALLFDERQASAPAGCAGTGVIRPGTASGPLLGGSLTLLAHLCGTPFFPPLDGAILFIEDVGEKPYKLDRYLTQLRLAGRLDRLAGVAVGQLTGCDEPEQNAAEIVREEIARLGVPAIEGIASGHEDLNLALPLGARVTLRAPGAGEEGGPQLVFEERATV
jgi:muramoyltetrapeptide carboxypeptidase